MSSDDNISPAYFVESLLSNNSANLVAQMLFATSLIIPPGLYALG